MLNFSFEKKIFLGIDIGTSSIKMVELKVVDKKPVLSNYAYMPLSEEILGKNESNNDYVQAIVARGIKRMLDEAKISANDVYISLPAFGGLISLIEIPEMADGDIGQAIKFEAHKYIPTALDEVVISWEIVERRSIARVPSGGTIDASAGSGVMIKVLLVAASRKKVLKYEGIVKAVGLRLKSVDIETFPVVRSLIGNDMGIFVIVDIGGGVCNIILVEKGMVRINRNIDSGGFEMTRTIAKGMNIDFERAEALKNSDKNFFATDSSISFFTLELISGEVLRIINAYSKNTGQKKIDGIILSGGVSRMVGITEYFSNKFRVNVVTGNPFSRVEYDNKLSLAVSDMQNSFSVAVGLALKGVDEYLESVEKK